MDTIKNTFYHILFVIISSLFIFFVTFCSNFMFGFCSSIALDPSSVPTLGNVFNEGIFSLGPNPGSANIYTLPIWFTESLEPWLYNEFGYDLENFTYDSEFGSVDMYSVLAQTINRGSISPEMVAQGYQVFSFASRAFGNQAKSYILGVYDSVSGTIKNVVDNAVTYIEDGFFSNFRNAFANDSISDTVINFSEIPNNIIYQDYISSSWVYDNITYSVYIKLSRPIYFYSYYNSDRICYSYENNFFISDYFVSGYYIDDNGRFTITSIEDLGSYSFRINGLDYRYGSFSFKYKDGNNIYSSYYYGENLTSVSLEDLKAFLSSYVFDDNYVVQRDYVDENGVAVDLGGILEGLEGHYVSQDDLAAIKSYIDSLVVDQDGNIVVTDENEGVISGLIDDAIADSTSIADELDSVVDDVIDIPINPSIPGGYFPSFIPDLLPDEMFSMFKPVLDIVGTNNSMYDIWIMIPVIFIAILVLYIIVSVL